MKPHMLNPKILVAGLALVAMISAPLPGAWAQGTGLRTGQIHEVQITSAADEGLEAHIPPDSWYAKAISFDAKQNWSASYNAQVKAIREFELMLKNGRGTTDSAQDRKTIRGWILKAREQRNISSYLKNRLRRRFRRTASTDCHLAPNFHDKWLAIRAFTGNSSQTLADKTLRTYRSCLGQRSKLSAARIGLAAMLNELGRFAEARAGFAKIANLKLWSINLELAYYHASAGAMTLALAYLEKALRNSRHNRKKALRSNRFDRLRGFPQFRRLVGSP
jgi:hypothetical protein